MLQQKVKIVNGVGIHARPASLLVQEATKYTCEIKIEKGSNSCNPKSILSVMALAAKQGDEITITTEGADESEAMEALVNLINSGFGEK